MQKLYNSRRSMARLAILFLALHVLSLLTLLFVLLGLNFGWLPRVDSNFDSVYVFISVLSRLIVVIGVITFLIWVSRSSKSLLELGVYDMEFTSGWAAAWFLIPIMNIFRPWQVMQEIWKASSPRDDGAAPIDWQNTAGTAYIALWWIPVIAGYYGEWVLSELDVIGPSYRFFAYLLILVLTLAGSGLQIGLIYMIEERLNAMESAFEPLVQTDAEPLPMDGMPMDIPSDRFSSSEPSDRRRPQGGVPE